MTLGAPQFLRFFAGPARSMPVARGAVTAVAWLALCATPALAQSGADIEQMRKELAALKEEQARTAQRIEAMERSLGVPSSTTTSSAAANTTVAPAAENVDATRVAAGPSRLQMSGDVRLRYEANQGDADGRNRHRGVVRARLRGSYAVSDTFMVGAQLSTGDSDDPNTADVTLSSFVDDLEVSLDQIYARATFGDLALTGGKIPLPFKRTDLVWDGDVSPQGLSASYRIPLPGGASLKASGLYFLIDEASRGPDSSMMGGQLEFGTGSGPWKFELAGAYYDYRLRALAGADAGDFRSNLLRPDGRYLSDFNLLDIVGTVGYSGFGDRWPIQVVGDYVHNFGAAGSADTGYSADIFVGKASATNDWRFGYGYARAEVDAVFAAFSHDNLDIATNYLLHTLSVDYVPQPQTVLNLTWYHYRPLDPTYAGANDPNDWLERIRLNFMLSF